MSDSRSIDHESRRLIREELLVNILVEAGAGSGKTQMLAERMAAGIASGVYQVENIAAVTFTRKAASELRGRFHLALEHELTSSVVQGGVSDVAKQLRIRSALSNLERFFAGTIHSFCARLLRERPVESGVSPGFTELDEVQDIELRKRAWRDFITNARAAGDPVIVELVETGVKPNDLDSAFATICLNDDVEFPPGEGVCPDPKATLEAIETFWKELQKHLPAEVDQDTTCSIQKAARTYRSQVRVSRHRLERAATIAALLETWDCDSKIVQNRWGTSTAEKRRFKNLIEPLHADFRANIVGPFLTCWRQYVYRLAVTLLTRARNHAADERRRLNTLNYGDLLNLSAKVLRENVQVRRALQRKYKHLFVDEFQDTDPIQAEIVFLLAASEMGSISPRPTVVAGYPDWRAVPLRPGALFVVGDPKQSIYRFRRADIEIYNTVRERLNDPAVGRVLPLTRNFRSVRNLCEWANMVFEKQFPTEPSAHSPRFALLDANDESSVTGAVFTITHNCDRNEALELDAERIATYIRSEVDAGRRKFSDFLILTRKKRDRISPYAKALESNNIPVEISGAGAFGDSEEVQALTVLLRAIADPQDALSLLAVLRGPLFGLSDRELFAFKQSGGWFSIFQEADSVAGTEPAQQSVCTALSALRQYYRWTRVLPAAGALERILEHTGYLALAATTPGGVEAGDLLHAIDRVRMDVEDGGSLADAATALEADGDDSNEVESLPLEPGRTDVTRVMNLHKAKGLEADVVFLADPCGGFGPRVDVHIERRDLTAFGWFEIVRRSETSYASKLLGKHVDWDDHAATELPYLDAEQDRLLYVAATRARKMLVVSRWMGNQKQRAWGVLNDFLANATELVVPQAMPAPTVDALDCSVLAQAFYAAVRVASHDTVREASWSITSVTAEARHIARIARSADGDADDPSTVVSTNTPAHRADAGMAWGTLIHGLLEHAMRHKAVTPEDLRRLGMWLTVEEPQLRPVLDLAVQTVLEVSEAAFWSQAHESDRSVETPFLFAARSGALVAGIIDLLFEQKGHWEIIDYKTDIAATGLGASYQEQLKMYEHALAAVGVPGVTTTIQPVRAGQRAEGARLKKGGAAQESLP